MGYPGKSSLRDEANQHPSPSLSPSRERVRPLLSPPKWPDAGHFQSNTALGSSPGSATDFLCDLGQFPSTPGLNFSICKVAIQGRLLAQVISRTSWVPFPGMLPKGN